MMFGVLAVGSASLFIYWPEDQLGLWGSRIVVIGLGAVAYAVAAGSQVSYVLWRALLALMPVSVLAIGVIFWVLPLLQLSEDFQKALVAGLVVAAGGLAGYVTQELRRLDSRNELRDDLLGALAVEVAYLVKRNSEIDWEAQKAAAQARFFKDRRYIPFVHLKLPVTALDKVLNNIELLSHAQIAPVVAYGHLVTEVGQMTETMRSDRYQELDAERREKVLLFWLDMQSRVPDAGRAVVDAITAQSSRSMFARPE
jgi:hypothetical protein